MRQRRKISPSPNAPELISPRALLGSSTPYWPIGKYKAKEFERRVEETKKGRRPFEGLLIRSIPVKRHNDVGKDCRFIKFRLLWLGLASFTQTRLPTCISRDAAQCHHTTLKLKFPSNNTEPRSETRQGYLRRNQQIQARDYSTSLNS